MFLRLNATAYDAKCNPKGKGDYLRRVPCNSSKICPDEDTPSNVITPSQFTFVISNLNQPRFWYISLVSCYRNSTTCEWEHYDDGRSHKINYHLELVNGNPSKELSTFYSPFVFHFSYDQQNILEQCLIFFAIYIFLVPIQIHGSRKQSHPVTKLFTMSIILEFVSICFILIHLIRFASNGEGNETLRVMGDVFDILSRTSFMLILLLLAKGWAVTRLEISSMSWLALIAIWISYLTLNFVLYVWNMTEIDVISDIDEFQTWPGFLVLISRSCIMLWFLYELRTTMKYEHSTKKLDFLLHFGASSLVWFIYLPIIALISMQVSVFWRYKLLLAVTNSVDCLAYCVMMGLLWPNRSGQYLLLAGPNTATDELDEFNEAPHNNREIYTDEIRDDGESG
jgi:Rhodopsin-like GPCR transmembrane domain